MHTHIASEAKWSDKMFVFDRQDFLFKIHIARFQFELMRRCARGCTPHPKNTPLHPPTLTVTKSKRKRSGNNQLQIFYAAVFVKNGKVVHFFFFKF